MAGSCQVHPQLRQSAIRYVASHSVASSLDAKEEASGPHLVGRTSLAMALPPTDAGGEGMMPMERLTAEDELMLWPDEIWPQDIGALAVLDGSSLLDRDGRSRMEAVRQAVAGRLHLVPRFRQPPTYHRDGWAVRCGWMLPTLILTTTLRSFDFRRPATRLSCCAQLSRCGGDVWTGHARCGRCGSSPGCRTNGWACL